MRRVRFRGGGVWPPTQNGLVVPLPKDRCTLLRWEGVEDAGKEGISDGVPECEVTLANRLDGSVGIESPSNVG